jgi:phytol kinase
VEPVSKVSKVEPVPKVSKVVPVSKVSKVEPVSQASGLKAMEVTSPSKEPTKKPSALRRWTRRILILAFATGLICFSTGTLELSKIRNSVIFSDIRTWFTVGQHKADAKVSLISTALAVLWVKINGFAASKGLVSSKLSRKLIHCSTAPIFMMLWPFYSTDKQACLIAALVPALNILKLYWSSLSKKGESSMAEAVSRSGDPKEVLGGPLLYTYVVAVCTVLGFRSTPAVVAMSQMAVGDGLADIVGRRFGKTKWCWNKNKSLVGSFAFTIGASLSTMGLLRWLGLVGVISTNLVATIALISTVCALVESLPSCGVIDDNLSVPIVGAALAHFLWQVPLTGI